MHHSTALDSNRLSQRIATIFRRPRTEHRHWRAALEWSGCVFGLLGAALLAMNSPESGYGFAAFLLSNLCWIAFAAVNRHRGLLLMQIGFLSTSVLGVWRWLL